MCSLLGLKFDLYPHEPWKIPLSHPIQRWLFFVNSPIVEYQKVACKNPHSPGLENYEFPISYPTNRAMSWHLLPVLPVSQSLSWDQVSSSKRAAGCVSPGRWAQERRKGVANKSYLNHIKIISKKWKTSIRKTLDVLKLWQFMCGNPIQNSTIPGNTMNGLWISSRNGRFTTLPP